MVPQRYNSVDKCKKRLKQQQYTATLKTLPTWDVRLFFHWWIRWKYPLSRRFPNFHVFHYTFARKQNKIKTQVKEKLYGQNKSTRSNCLVSIQSQIQLPATMKINSVTLVRVNKNSTPFSVEKNALILQDTYMSLQSILLYLLTASKSNQISKKKKNNPKPRKVFFNPCMAYAVTGFSLKL